MERKIVDTINNPLMYISQPIYPPAKPKMQQSYVWRSAHKIEKALVIPVPETKVEEKQVTIEAVITESKEPLKKNPIEEKITPIKSRIEESNKKVVDSVEVPINVIKLPTENHNINIIKEKIEPIANKIQENVEPIKATIENKQDAFKKILKEKLPALEDIITGKPVHIQNKAVEQTVPLSSPVEGAAEANTEPEVDVISEAAKEKRRLITTFGIKSSIEKGRKATVKPKKQPLPLSGNDIVRKQQQKHQQNNPEMVQQELSELLLEQEQHVLEQNQGTEVKKKTKSFKEMSIEEKVEYMVHLPIAVPKVKCEIKTKDHTLQGIIAGYTNGIVQIVQRRKPFRVDLRIEDIIGINRKSF